MLTYDPHFEKISGVILILSLFVAMSFGHSVYLDYIAVMKSNSIVEVHPENKIVDEIFTNSEIHTVPKIIDVRKLSKDEYTNLDEYVFVDNLTENQINQLKDHSRMYRLIKGKTEKKHLILYID